MQLTEINCGKRAFFATWADHSVTELPFIWLRDNDNAELHPDTRERVFDLMNVSLDIQPDSGTFMRITEQQTQLIGRNFQQGLHNAVTDKLGCLQ